MDNANDNDTVLVKTFPRQIDLEMLKKNFIKLNTTNYLLHIRKGNYSNYHATVTSLGYDNCLTTVNHWFPACKIKMIHVVTVLLFNFHRVIIL